MQNRPHQKRSPCAGNAQRAGTATKCPEQALQHKVNHGAQGTGGPLNQPIAKPIKAKHGHKPVSVKNSIAHRKGRTNQKPSCSAAGNQSVDTQNHESKKRRRTRSRLHEPDLHGAPAPATLKETKSKAKSARASNQAKQKSHQTSARTSPESMAEPNIDRKRRRP